MTMASAPEFVTHLVRSARGRNEDPIAPALVAVDDAAAAATSDQPESIAPPHEAGASHFDAGIVGVVAEKVLLAWLRNRYQLLFPFALDLQHLAKPQATLLVHAMIAAAQADGSLDGKEQARIEGTLRLVGATEDERAILAAAISRPKPLNDILGEVRDVQTGALVYAASLMAIDHRKPVNGHYLRYLAARLQLSDELVQSLEQRYRSAG
jgi:uncharacterized membrane protein YebE (DUF533 family)